MYFALLIHADEDALASRTPDELVEVAQGIEALDRELTELGKNLGSLRLCSATAGTVIQVRGGRTMSTDGPFTETKEQLGGIYLVEAADEAEARSIAARIPVARYGSVEVRELVGVDLRGALAHYPES